MKKSKLKKKSIERYLKTLLLVGKVIQNFAFSMAYLLFVHFRSSTLDHKMRSSPIVFWNHWYTWLCTLACRTCGLGGLCINDSLAMKYMAVGLNIVDWYFLSQSSNGRRRKICLNPQKEENLNKRNLRDKVRKILKKWYHGLFEPRVILQKQKMEFNSHNLRRSQNFIAMINRGLIILEWWTNLVKSSQTNKENCTI